MEPNYSHASLALSIWYPENWAYEEAEDGVIFGTSEALISGEALETGAAMAIMRERLEDEETIKDLAQTTLENLYFEELETSDPQPHSVGDQRGIIINLEGTPEEASVPFRGILAMVERGDWVYLFLGVSVIDDWSEYGDTLEKMLRSVVFEAVENVYSSDTLGLRIWFPENWVYEDDRDQIIFASSAGLFESGDLESGAAMLVSGSSLPDVSLEEWFEDQSADFDFEDGGPTSDIETRTIGGQSGLIFTLEGLPVGSETPVKGFVAAAEYGDWGYLFLGVSVVDEWAEQGPVLEEMLCSVQFH
jgi:hypothetical protein